MMWKSTKEDIMWTYYIGGKRFVSSDRATYNLSYFNDHSTSFTGATIRYSNLFWAIPVKTDEVQQTTMNLYQLS